MRSFFHQEQPPTGGERSNAAPSAHHPSKGGERSKAAGAQAVRRQTIVTRAPRSRARLQHEPTRRRLVAKPRTPHLIPQAAQLFKLPACNVGGRGERPSSFSGGYKGGILFEKRIPPLHGSSAKSCTDSCSAAGAATTHPHEGRSKGIPSSRREYPLFLAATQRAALTHAAPLALHPPSPGKGEQQKGASCEAPFFNQISRRSRRSY